VFEEGFTENDEMWTPDSRESASAQEARLKDLLVDLFSDENSVFLSLTSHSGAITSLLSAIGHRKFHLATGAVIPALVKATTIDGQAPSSSVEPSTKPPVCTGEPNDR
jgi:hypothetical protein